MALSQERRGTPTTTGSATEPDVAGNRTQEPPPGVRRDRPHKNHTPSHINTSSKPQPGRTATRRHTRANTHGRHTHTHTTATNTQRTHQHLPRHKHTQHGKPPTKPRGNSHHHSQRTPARRGRNHAQDPQSGEARGYPPPTPTGPQPGVAGDRTRGPQPGEAREHPPRTISRKRGTTPSKPVDHSQEWRRPSPPEHQRTQARSGWEPHPRPGPTAREGWGPPAATGGEPQPGVVGTRTQATRPGKAKSAPNHHQTTREERETHRCKPHSEKGAGRKVPT